MPLRGSTHPTSSSDKKVTKEAQLHQKQSPNLHLRHSRAGGNPVLAVRAATTPHPNPRPQGERGLKAVCRETFDSAFDVGVDVLPRVAAPSITARGDQARA